jgi:hypothetical protein
MLKKREAGSLGLGSEEKTSSRELKFIWLNRESVESIRSSEVEHPLEARRKTQKR